jgi:hypothetical protein
MTSSGPAEILSILAPGLPASSDRHDGLPEVEPRDWRPDISAVKRPPLWLGRPRPSRPWRFTVTAFRRQS